MLQFLRGLKTKQKNSLSEENVVKLLLAGPMAGGGGVKVFTVEARWPEFSSQKP